MKDAAVHRDGEEAELLGKPGPDGLRDALPDRPVAALQDARRAVPPAADWRSADRRQDAEAGALPDEAARGQPWAAAGAQSVLPGVQPAGRPAVCSGAEPA
jgi:hypothetical protein